MTIKNKWGLLLPLYLLPVIFLALFFFYPLAGIFNLSFGPEGVFEWDRFWATITSDYYRRVLTFTVWQATLSTLLTLALALPCAYVFTRYQFRGKSLLLSLATLPFVLPTVVVAAAFRALLWDNGLLNEALMRLFMLDSPPLQVQRSLVVILLAHVFYNFAVAMRIIVGYWANQTVHIEEAAQVLGANRWRLWWNVRLPILRPAIMAAGALVFIFTFTSFGVVLLLGGFRYSTLEVEIYYQARDIFDLPVAGTLALIQIIFMLVMMTVYTRLQNNMTVDLQSMTRVQRKPQRLSDKLIVGSAIGLIITLIFAPLGALVWRSLSFHPNRGLFHHYQNLLENRVVGSRIARTMTDVIGSPPLEIIGNSLKFAILSTVFAIVLGLLTAYLLSGRWRGARWLDPIFMMPLATSAVTLGFGFILTMNFNGIRDTLNDLFGLSIQNSWDLRASWVLIPIAHVLVSMPFVVRSVLPVLRSVSHSIYEAADVLGASPLKRWLWVELPLISRAVVVGGTFAFTMSMGEFGASLFVARQGNMTVPIGIQRLLGQSGTAGDAYALSVLLLIVCAVSFIVIERIRGLSSGEF
jgi:thiamine transport system permease protein